ncbi:MAG: hypothetical protein EOM50_01125 [Erysipelotrichia bacterium]|nr:hypothetical protein [Erysipelotrichia bacterium]
MAKKGRRKKRLNPLFKSLTLFVMLIVSGVLLYSVFTEVLETRQLKDEIAQAKAEQKSLKDKKENLNTQKSNLNDTEYLIRYARAKYLATKEDGEQVFKISDEDSKKEAQSN